jgi:hypothetical protein
MSTVTPFTRSELAYALVDQLSTWPFVRVERLGRRATVLSGVQELAVGVIDLREGQLTVAVPPGLAGPLAERHPLLEPAGRGVRIALSDDEHCAAARAILRWRIDRERFAAQGAEASP